MVVVDGRLVYQAANPVERVLLSGSFLHSMFFDVFLHSFFYFRSRAPIVVCFGKALGFMLL